VLSYKSRKTDLKILLSKFSRATYVLKYEGWYAFFRQGFSYISSLLLSYGNYFVYQFDFGQRELPIIELKAEYFFASITSLADFENLLAQGYSFGNREFRKRLDKGAVAFCVFVDRVLAAECWIATIPRAKKVVDPLPFYVDFDNREACTGVRFTNPKFRRNGFSVFTHLARLAYLKEHGFTKAKASVNVKNIVSQATNEKYFGKKVSKGRYIRILGWHYWKEKSLV
jgi:hypothetical protein